MFVLVSYCDGPGWLVGKLHEFINKYAIAISYFRLIARRNSTIIKHNHIEETERNEARGGSGLQHKNTSH